jgi:glycosyltransferase involved in cell wall biosynthesis
VIRVLAISTARDVMGTEHSLLNLAPWLAAHDVEMTLAAAPGGELEKRWRDLGLPFVGLKLPERQGVRPHSGIGYNQVGDIATLPLRTALAVWRIGKLARRADADVIHSNGLITHLDCAVAGRLTGTKVVLELHDIVAPGPGRVLMGVAVRLAGSAIAISTAVRRQLPRWAARRAVVIGQGIDVGHFTSAGARNRWRDRLTSSPGSPVIAAIGRLDPEKGLHTLIHAVALVRRSGADVQLALVGKPGKDDGGYRDRLAVLGAELLPGAFRMFPPVPDVADVLRSIDVLACPSVEEPFGLILLEAQACGIPVVANGSGGPLDFITHEETGMLVAANNPQGYADVISQLLTDPRLRARVSRGGQDSVRNTYRAQIRAQKVADVYRERLIRAVVP